MLQILNFFSKLFLGIWLIIAPIKSLFFKLSQIGYIYFQLTSSNVRLNFFLLSIAMVVAPVSSGHFTFSIIIWISHVYASTSQPPVLPGCQCHVFPRSIISIQLSTGKNISHNFYWQKMTSFLLFFLEISFPWMQWLVWCITVRTMKYIGSRENRFS